MYYWTFNFPTTSKTMAPIEDNQKTIFNSVNIFEFWGVTNASLTILQVSHPLLVLRIMWHGDQGHLLIRCRSLMSTNLDLFPVLTTGVGFDRNDLFTCSGFSHKADTSFLGWLPVPSAHNPDEGQKKVWLPCHSLLMQTMFFIPVVFHFFGKWPICIR